MANITDYVKNKGRLSFLKLPFSDVDSLVLSQLSYLQYDSYVDMNSDSAKTLIRLKDILIDMVSDRDKFESLFKNVWDAEAKKELFIAASKSQRFKNISLMFYRNELMPEDEKQFCAITFLIDGYFPYIAYRGTDSTVVGWKEDFNMAFMSVIPSQITGLKYLNYVAGKLSGPLVLGGHSKGGNIAVFSAITCEDFIRDRIITIYNHDGPGFMDKVFSLKSYIAIKNRIRKTVPQSSIIGMLLQQHEDFTIIKSSSVGIVQHEPFTWEVENTYFVHIDELSDSSKHLNTAINEWLQTIDEPTRELFVETLFSIIEATGVFYLDELRDNWLKNARTVLEAIKNIDPDTKEKIESTLSVLFKMAGDSWQANISWPTMNLPAVHVPRLPFKNRKRKDDQNKQQ